MRLPLILGLALWPGLSFADDVTETMDAARAAYEEGDIAYAMEELTFAIQLMKQMRSGSLGDLLPAAQEGWERTLDAEEAQAMAMMGGTAAVAEYARDDASFTITIMADNPMMAGLAAAFANPAMMGTMGELTRVGREKFLNQDGELTGLIGGRILVQASGADPEAILAHLETIDFAALESFGS